MVNGDESMNFGPWLGSDRSKRPFTISLVDIANFVADHK